MAGIKVDMKFAFNVISLLGAIGWGWYQMELRVTALEMKIEHNEKMAKLRDEIQGLKSNGQLKNSGN
jgi:hypothetical protein|tara:strand:- start:1637 stop:1837 length:201 start_codon:yes stop_codon:yes gene_type:complete